MGASLLQRFVRAVLWVNMYVVAGAGIALVYALRRERTILTSVAYNASLVMLAAVLVVAKGMWSIVLMPFHHLALAIVAAAVAIEALLAGRVFVQLAYEDNVDGIAGTVLNLTDPIVAPFSNLEGTAILHDTGVVEFATLTAMEAVLVGALVTVVMLMFWSEFLHMYRRVRDFFIERSQRRKAHKEAAQEQQPALEAAPAPIADMTATADLSAAS